MARSSLGKLVGSTDDGPGTALFICDVQERFRDTIQGYPAVIDTAVRLVRPDVTTLSCQRTTRASECHFSSSAICAMSYFGIP